MSFVSYSFGILLLIVMLARLTIGKTHTGRSFSCLLLLASLVFYAWHIPKYLAILVLSTTIDFWAGQQIAKAETSRRWRKIWLGLSLSANLGLLFFFKYCRFLLAEIEVLAQGLGFSYQAPYLPILLPMGISFYTFQSMSYTIDVYRRELRPVDRFSSFLCFVSFFPQLVAGPIVRAKDFLYQMKRRRTLHFSVLNRGVYLLIRGYFLKTVIADNLGKMVDGNWGLACSPEGGGALALLVTAMFAAQIFCDFSGYSSIARGVAYLLGYQLPKNFNSPYIAGSFKDFWSRWHITLSQWLRDYLYIPLGGNKLGTARTYFNLMAVMTLGGLWHGAANTFIIWGLIHGAALCIERFFHLEDIHRSGRILQQCLWFVFVHTVILLTWAFFRSADLSETGGLISNVLMLKRGPGFLESIPPVHTALLMLVPVTMHLRSLCSERGWFPSSGGREQAVLAAAMFYACLTLHGDNSGFIYFQF